MFSRTLILVLTFLAAGAGAQTVLLDENFNTCALPAGWQVRIMGDNLSPIWYVGLAQNASALGQSIDGSCFLFIDDESGGVTAPGYMLEFVSPAFNAAPYTTVMCSMDVHFRFGANDFLQIFVSDGMTETLLARFDNYSTNYEGLDKGDYFKLRHDLAFVSQSPQTKLIFRYSSPNGSKGKYAGIDNVRVTGSGAGTNVLLEDFDLCQKPPGWTTQVVAGQQDWSFGFVPIGSSAFYEGSSMNGTCFVFFDDNKQGDTAPASTIRLRSPWFSGTQFFEYKLTYDAIMRYSGYESFAVFVENEKGETTQLAKTEGHVAGPFFPNYGSFDYDLSPYRSQQLRIIFEYADGGVHGYWSGIDNVKVTGSGPALDFCANAVAITTAAPCLPANNTNALFNGPTSTCADRSAGSLWFRWTADFTGVAKLTTRADFNDVVNVFTGGCANPQPLVCDNRDEHGFAGETTYFPAQTGTQYFFRVSGVEGGFGLTRGQVCIGLEQAANFPVRPANDDCATAHVIAVGGPCKPGNNRNAAMSPFQPSHNRLARADVWYRFVAPALTPGQTLELTADADFSHIITLYSGTCTSLTELATNHNGGALTMPALTAGQTYSVQIAGVFATVEGVVCPELHIRQAVVPANDACTSATAVVLNAGCLPATNLGAAFSGVKPSCAVAVDRDVWFQFTAPGFGSVQVNTGARFEHTLAVWEGDCNDLKQVFCTVNPLPCNGYVTVPNLNNGQTYYLQIASLNGASGVGSGDICLKIRNAALPSDFKPLGLTVQELCVGKDSVKLLTTVTGGTLPYSFLADTAGQIVSSGVPWAVQVRDAIGCQTYQADTAKTCLANACTANVEIVPTPPTCFGKTDGVLSAAVLSGGTGPFFFEWSNHIFTANNANLAPGTYSLTISETTGCTYVLEAELGDHDSLRIEIAAVPPTCFGDSDGVLSALVVNGGIWPVTFSWSNQATTAENANLTAGTYTLTVTESTGCTHVVETILEQFDSLLFGIDMVHPSCFGTSDGSLSVSIVGGGAVPLLFEWSNQVFSPDNPNLPAGTYTLTITENTGCTHIYEAALEQPDSLRLDVVTVQPSCFGDTDGSLSVSVAGGGGGPFSFKWSNQVLSPDNPNLAAGTYSLTITENNGCTYVSEAMLVQPDSLYLLFESLQHPVQGASNGSIHVSQFGGTPPVAYSWFLNNTVFITATQDLDGVPGGTYILYVMDANGCWDSLSRTLVETVGTHWPDDEPFGVRVFPNPASEQLIVAVSSEAPLALEVTLTDMLGRTCLRQTAQPGSEILLDLDVRALSPGMYALRLQASGYRVTRRVLIGR
ncbi:MAG: T9SS type A sorting domain-containing protein [Saprospiraceae bacterium]